MGAEAILPHHDGAGVARLLGHCPVHAPTTLKGVPALAESVGVAEVWVKDERNRMGLGSFKALGAAHAIARRAETTFSGDWSTALAHETFVTASAGNHGLSVAAGARIFGAKAVIYLAETVPDGFAQRLKDKGAVVKVEGADYEASMEAAAKAAAQEGWVLLSDSSWQGYVDLPMAVMEGYLQMAAEAADAMPFPPTHILLQAGVGGLAAAVAAHARAVWGDGPQLIVVEPEAAPALFESIKAGRRVTAAGPVSTMGRLDCKTPSLVALNGLARDADVFVTLSEENAASGIRQLAAFDLATTPSGGAGLAARLTVLDLGPAARVLAFLSEGPDGG